MRRIDDQLYLSATDISNHASCAHLTSLNLERARGRLEPPYFDDPTLDLLKQRGDAHERAFVDYLRSAGKRIVEIDKDQPWSEAAGATRRALSSGADVIVQAALMHDRWHGRADVLLRVERPSALGAWSYEPIDTKLASETRASAILQLCSYAELLEAQQGVLPERVHVVTPGTGFVPQRYRVRDYFAYYRHCRHRLEAALAAGNRTSPEPTDHCGVCDWQPICDARRRELDHPSLIAGITRLQTRELASTGVMTMQAIADLPLPLTIRPSRGALETYVRVREQARVQCQGRQQGRLLHEVLPVQSGRGLARLPTPSEGDVFLDLEGDPFVCDGGREYLFGLSDRADTYQAYWATTAEEERAAFERVVDDIMARWSRDPGMHIYHYAPYEPGALKRLMGRYGTRKDELDALLRAERFVDLCAILKQSVRASVERYSLKTVEPLYGYERALPLPDARRARRDVEYALEGNRLHALDGALKAQLEAYNRDDCVSAARLRDWLETLRAQHAADLPRPVSATGEATEAIAERQARVAALAARLAPDIPADPALRTPDQQARWLLANLLDFHRREDSVKWWEYFRLRDLSDDDCYDEPAAVAGLELVERVGGTAKYPIHRYRFPQQTVELKPEDLLHTGDQELGDVVAIDRAARLIDIKKRGATANTHPTSAFTFHHFSTKVISRSIFALGERIADHGFDEGVATQLLFAKPPRFSDGTTLPCADGADATELACRLGLRIDRSVLAIQGPPGTGKTTTAARMIRALVRAGKRVGVTANSHKVILNLLEAVVASSKQDGEPIQCIHKADAHADGPVRETSKPADVLRALVDGTAPVAGGTAWLWSRDDFAGAVDVLFVDEAGQMSLANTLAASRAASSLVLLGDPRQLDQPQQATHPEGTDVSALGHLLRGAQTVPPDRGLFLGVTRRLAPAICRFTSELFYEGKLEAARGLEQQRIEGTTPFAGAGLFYVPVEHHGNRNVSPEEVDAVTRIVEGLVQPGTTWIDDKGQQRHLGPADVLVIAPYNAHVNALDARLGPQGIRVGTVDRFQGQEAPVVIYALATSTPEDAPRGMEFLYSLNRLNVATSRARCVCILVGSPKLFDPHCRTVHQLQLANAFCRYLELCDRTSRSKPSR